jgi:hypothetical protein
VVEVGIMIIAVAVAIIAGGWWGPGGVVVAVQAIIAVTIARILQDLSWAMNESMAVVVAAIAIVNSIAPSSPVMVVG